MLPRPPTTTLFPYTTLFRSAPHDLYPTAVVAAAEDDRARGIVTIRRRHVHRLLADRMQAGREGLLAGIEQTGRVLQDPPGPRHPSESNRGALHAGRLRARRAHIPVVLRDVPHPAAARPPLDEA